MKTEAQKRARRNYEKKLKQIIIRFYPKQEDQRLYEWIKEQENSTGYIKDLVTQDMKNKGRL